MDAARRLSMRALLKQSGFNTCILANAMRLGRVWRCRQTRPHPAGCPDHAVLAAPSMHTATHAYPF
ncbi:putative carboxypeptidase [Xanthomonas oryzae pv. oryzae PXO99A]|uniref:Putative carboxypeptidase n=1 Tax=Xanthomonas oryzae pv. oryzae (strain PXO99A) TaxID=360094 RepID=A0A0K0GG72_XANOP|nr:putative carboxypeptidase [Xanthomonas oryzae pv. oryzae PXO99A]